MIGLCLASASALAADPVVNASFTTSGITTSVASANHTTLQFTISNQVGDAAASVSFTETLPASLRVAATPAKGGTCAGAVAATTAVAGATTITVTNLAIGAGPSSCTVTVDVTVAGSGAASGNYNASCAAFPANFTTLPANITSITNATVDGAIQSCVTVGTYPSLETPADRFGSSLNCTANDISIANVNVVGTTQCIFGQQVTLALTSDISVTASGRYDIGIFIAQDGGNLLKQSTAGGAASSSVITFPSAIPPVLGALDADTCIDGSSGGTLIGVALPVPVTVNCTPNPTTGFLDLNSLITWDNTSGNNCGGGQDVVPNTKSKCNASTSATTVQVVGQINITKVIVGGSATSFDFSAANTTTPASAPTPPAFSLTTGATQLISTAQLIQAGEHYLVTETQNPAYILTSIVCTDGGGQPSPNVVVSTAAGTVDANMSTVNGIVNCTYTNTVRPVLPALIKSFNPTSIESGGTTVLTYTVSNPVNGGPAIVHFTDALPSGLQLANGTVGGTCVGFTIKDAADATLAAGSTSVKVTNLPIAPGVTCTITVNVTNKPGQSNSSCAQLPSAFTNGPGNVTLDVENLANLINPSCVVVSTPPTLTKAFSPTTITIGGTTVLTLTVDNTQTGSIMRTGISFTDTLPAGLVLVDGVDTGTCAYTITNSANAPLAAGSTSVKITNLTIAANATCTIALGVTNALYQVNSSCNGNPPNFTNTANSITNLNGVVNGVQSSCVVVNPLVPSLNKAFNPTTINSGGTTVLTFTITNPAPNNPAQVVSFTDNLPSSLQVAATPGIVNNCTGGTVTAVAGATSIVVATTVGQSTASPTTCTIAVNVTNKPGLTGTCPDGNFTNTANSITGLVNLNNAVAPSCVTVNPLVPTLTKSFSPSTINLGGTTTLTFTVTNPANNPALSNVGFVDTLPSGLQIAATPAVGGTCSNAVGATTAVASGATITVAGLSVPAGASSCTVTVNVTNKPGQANPSCASLPAAFTNTSASVTVSNVTNGVQPSCVIVNTFSFSITKTPSITTVTPGSALSFTIVVTNNGPSAADGSVISDPAIPFYAVSAVSCVGTTGGASCPAPLSVAALQGAGMTVTTFPAGATITLQIDGITSLTNGVMINTVTVNPPAGIPGVAQASASASVATKAGAIPTLSPTLMILLLLTLGAAGAYAARRSKQ